MRMRKEIFTHPVTFNFKRRKGKEKVKSDPLTIVDSLKTRCSTSNDNVMGDEILHADCRPYRQSCVVLCIIQPFIDAFWSKS